MEKREEEKKQFYSVRKNSKAWWSFDNRTINVALKSEDFNEIPCSWAPYISKEKSL